MGSLASLDKIDDAFDRLQVAMRGDKGHDLNADKLRSLLIDR